MLEYKNNKDEFFLKLLHDLSEDIINDTQSAANKTIDLSSQFLDLNNKHLVDDLRLLNKTVTNKNKKDSDYKKHLSVVQTNMKQMTEKSALIRSEVNVVLSAMQFSELLRQHLAGINLSFEVMIDGEEDNEDTLKLAMQKKMHTFDERKAFHEYVMHEEMPAADQEVTQDLIDQLIG